MPRKKKDDASKSTKSGGKKPEEPKPEAQEPEPTPEPEPDPPANAPTVEKNRPAPPPPPLTRKQAEAKKAKERAEAGITTSTDGRRARPPMKGGKIDLKQAETWSKNPKTGLLTYFFSNGAVVREDEL